MEVFPPSAVLDGKGEKQRVVVRAKYSRRHRPRRDEPRAVPVEQRHRREDRRRRRRDRRRARRGVRHGPVPHLHHRRAVHHPAEGRCSSPGRTPPENNYIDTLVHAKLKKLRIEPSRHCAPTTTFVRRVYLDIIGILPTPDEYARFMVSHAAEQAGAARRRTARPQGVRRAVGAEVGGAAADPLEQPGQSYKAMLLYYGWLQEKIAKNVPTDEWVKELLGANGGTFKNPATNYYQLETDVLKVTENVAQVFMGMRVQCAQCHNHPFDRWTMDDYYGVRLVLHPDRPQGRRRPARADRLQLRRRRGQPPGPRPADEAEVPRRRRARTWPARTAAWCWPTGSPVAGEPVLRQEPVEHRLGPLLRPGDRQRGGRRAHLEPGVRTRNCSTNWARSSPAYKYDFKKLVRDICTSQTYQRSTQPTKTNEGDTRNFARGPIRRIRAETMLDIITQVTDTKNKFQGLPLGARAVQIADGRREHLLPHHVRPADARDGLLVRGAAGADAVAEPAPAERRHGGAEDRSRATSSARCCRRRRRRRR